MDGYGLPHTSLGYTVSQNDGPSLCLWTPAYDSRFSSVGVALRVCVYFVLLARIDLPSIPPSSSLLQQTSSLPLLLQV